MTLNLGKLFYLSEENENKITLWLNHLLVIYSFLIPIHNGAKSSLFFTMLVLFLFRRNYWYYLKEAFSNKIVQAILLFYILHLVGLIYTDNIDYGKSHMDKIKYFLFPLIFLSFLDVRFVFRIVAAFIIGIFISVIFSYLIHYGILPYEFIAGKYEIWKTEPYSPAPFMAHSDHGVGISLLVGLLLYYVLNFNKISRLLKYTILIIVIISLFNMSFIASRTGYATLIAVLFVSILLSFRNQIKHLFVATILFIISLLGLYNFSDTVNQRVNRTIVNFTNVLETKNFFQSGSTGQRIGLTLYGFEVFKNSPYIGVGTGDHMDSLREQYPEDQKSLNIIGKPHNVYIQILMQHGLLGMFLFIFMIYRILRYKNISREKKDILIIITTSTLVFMAGGLLYGTFELPIFVMFISLMITKKTQNIDPQKFDNKLLFKYFIFATLFLIIGITR